MKTSILFDTFSELEIDFYAGVPDSQLKNICNYIENHFPHNNWVVPNEGMAVAAVAGHYLSTGKMGCVYMQNSGIGNAINPICSLTSPLVYAIPMIFIIGWRGEHGRKDEPQHVFQGVVTDKFLETLAIPYIIAEPDTDEFDFKVSLLKLSTELKIGKSIAILVKKDAFSCDEKVKHINNYEIVRENAVAEVINCSSENDVIVSSTGKISRELFEIRKRENQGHSRDFLTVGSMGYCSTIALSVAYEKPKKNIICIDGDGALLMHMGSIAMIGSKCLKNLTHVVLDNQAHETVGGMPTISNKIDFCKIAIACGYKFSVDIHELSQIKEALEQASKTDGSSFIRIYVSLESRNDLGRPDRTPIENRDDFMRFLRDIDNEC